MNTKETRPVKISFPISLYFKQLFSHDTYVRFINPFGFWRRYRIQHLETCHELDIVEYLERCHQLKWQASKAINCGNTKFTEIFLSSHFPVQQLPPNAILIIQPSIKLKYRGVTYQTKKILSININNVQFEPGIVELDSSQQPLNSKNINTPEKSGSS